VGGWGAEELDVGFWQATVFTSGCVMGGEAGRAAERSGGLSGFGFGGLLAALGG
jgi:hypothetical protein